MERIYEDRFFSLYKDSDKAYSVATLCAQALREKYDIDKCYSNSGETSPHEAKVYVYNDAVTSIEVVSKTVDIEQIDLDILFKEIEDNLKGLNDAERRDYCISLLVPFGDGCSFIDTYLPLGKINRIKARIERYAKEKNELERSVASNDAEELRKQSNKSSLAHLIESDEKMIKNVLNIAYRFVKLPSKGPVEKFYSKLYMLLQRYAYRLAWTFVKNGIDIFPLQDECNIYIINPQQGHDVSIYAQWAGSCKLAQKGVDALYDRAVNENSISSLPCVTEGNKKYFERALECGWIEVSGKGCTWLYGGRRGQVRLGYFCSKVYDMPRPINTLEEVFNVKKLSSSITNAEVGSKRADVVRWKKEMDDRIFFD